MKDLIDTILFNTYTRRDLYHRTAVMMDFLQQHRYTTEDGGDVLDALRSYMDAKGEQSRTRTSLVAWGSTFWQEVTSRKPAQVREVLDTQIESLPVVVLYTPAELSDERADEFGRWFRRVNERVVLYIRPDPRMAGGCAFTLGATYYDYSFRARLRATHDQIVRQIKAFTRAT